MTRRPLRLLIPAVLLAVGLIVTAIGAFAEILSRHQDLELDFADRAASLGNREVSNIEYALARDDLDSARLQVTLLVSEPGLDLALLADENLQVMQATRGEFRGRPLSQTLGKATIGLLEGARAMERGQTRLSEDGNRFEAAFPVHLHLKPGELRSTRVGVLYLSFNLSDAHAMARAHAIREAAALAVGMLALCVLAGLYLRHVISRRVSLLLQAVNRYAGGDFHARAEVGGRDELTDLADGFNGMAARLQSRETSLRQVNEDLRQSETRFRQVVENINEVFWIVEVASGKTVYTSPAYEKIWGRPLADLVASPRGWLDAIHPEDRPRVEQAFRDHAASGRFDEVFRVLRPDGSQRWVRDRGFPVYDEAGKLLSIVGVAEDITERRDLEAQYHQAQKLEAVGRLAGGIAHDFNNLLTAILGNAQLALEDLESGQIAVDSMKEIQRAGERAKSLVQQILVFNRGLPQNMQVVSLAQLLREVASQAKPSLPPGSRLELQVAEDLPNVLGHATRLHQVLMNLVTNAGHALDGKSGAIEVSLSAVRVDAAMARQYPGLPEGPALCLKVRDSGRGMDVATQSRIFEPFFTTREAGQGTGLGLSLAYAIVREHQGAIDVASQPGEGSEFTVYLPATTLPMPVAAAKPAAAERGQGERVLYLDDDEALVSLISRSLRRLGYQVTSFTDQEEALRHFAADPLATDVFVTDYNMPGLSGLDVARKVLEIRPGMPVLLISGYVTEALVHTARQAGVRKVLEKPDGIAALTHGVDAALKD